MQRWLGQVMEVGDLADDSAPFRFAIPSVAGIWFKARELAVLKLTIDVSSTFESRERRPDAALLYVDIYAQPEQTPYQKMLVREPMVPAYEGLRFTDLIDVAVLPPILDMMDVLLGELREARAAAPRRCEVGAANVPSSGTNCGTDTEPSG